MSLAKAVPVLCSQEMWEDIGDHLCVSRRKHPPCFTGQHAGLMAKVAKQFIFLVVILHDFLPFAIVGKFNFWVAVKVEGTVIHYIHACIYTYTNVHCVSYGGINILSEGPLTQNDHSNCIEVH